MLDIKFELDPVKDGIAVNANKIIRKDEGGLVIATNGDFRCMDVDQVSDLLDDLWEVSCSESMGNSGFIVILNARKIIRIGGSRYFIGSALIMKEDDGGITTLTGDEYEKAKKEFNSRLVTLVCDGQEFSAYELIL